MTPSRRTLVLIFIAAVVGAMIGWTARAQFLRTVPQPQPPVAERPNPLPEASPKPPEFFACTMDAKACPDGSGVGRSGPRCAFAACPFTPVATTSWTTFNGAASFQIRHPGNWTVETETWNAGLATTYLLRGPEGEMRLSEGTGFGGMCGNSWTYVQIQGEQLLGCEGTLTDGSYIYTQLSKNLPSGDGQAMSFDGMVQVKPGSNNREVVLTILSTLQFHR